MSNKRRATCCSICKKRLFYLPEGYKMDCKVICVDCGDGVKKKKRIRTAAGNFAHAVKGIRKDIHRHYCFRSKTEANFARVLKFLKTKWAYEELKFEFHGAKRKPYSYLMDFEIKESTDSVLIPGLYEIKGYMDGRSRNKLRSLKKYYPEDAARTTVVLYSKRVKKDILFCEKLGYRYLFYDELKEKFKEQIPKWE